MRKVYRANKQIVIFGGHETWSKEIQKLLSNMRDIRFEYKNKNPNELLIRNSKQVWIQPNCICHTYYHKIFDLAKLYKIPVFFFNFVSAKKCAEQLLTENK